MPACKRVRLTGTIPVPLPPTDAITLFTPTGERAWAPGWDPQFPSPVPDDTEPGTVFQTDHAGRRSTWTVTRHDPATTIQYATTTPGDRAGLVTVACTPGEDDTTTATVSYDLTTLAPEANADLDRFAAHYRSFLGQWQHAIAQAITASGHPT
jgi:Polyketide cyclase / dehydrase and lipid transport